MLPLQSLLLFVQDGWKHVYHRFTTRPKHGGQHKPRQRPAMLTSTFHDFPSRRPHLSGKEKAQSIKEGKTKGLVFAKEGSRYHGWYLKKLKGYIGR